MTTQLQKVLVPALAFALGIAGRLTREELQIIIIIIVKQHIHFLDCGEVEDPSLFIFRNGGNVSYILTMPYSTVMFLQLSSLRISAN